MKWLYKLLAASTLVMLCTALAVAQAKPEGKKATSSKKESRKAAKNASGQSMSMISKPSPEMQKIIKMFAGTWSSTEKHEPSEFLPNGGTGTGSDTVKAGPGGNSLISDYRSKGAMGGSFSGHGIIYWDAKHQAYSSVWCDNMSSEGCEVGATGKWEGNDLVFTAEGEMMGKKYEMKQVYTDIKPDSYTFYMDMSNVGGPMKRTMTITYTRKVEAKSSAAPPKQ